jgi:hypothetical protein
MPSVTGNLVRRIFKRRSIGENQDSKKIKISKEVHIMSDSVTSLTQHATQSAMAWFTGKEVGKKDGKANAVPDKETPAGMIKKGTEIIFSLLPGTITKEVHIM